MENGPRLDGGKNGKKWPKNGFLREFPIIFQLWALFFAIFAPVQLGAVFHFDFHFFSISDFWPFSMPYQPGMIPTLSIVTLVVKKKQHKHKLFGPDFPRTFLTLTPGCPGVKKFLPATGAAGKRTFWCGRPRFSARTSMTRRVVEKLCTEKVCVDFLSPNLRL